MAAIGIAAYTLNEAVSAGTFRLTSNDDYHLPFPLSNNTAQNFSGQQHYNIGANNFTFFNSGITASSTGINAACTLPRAGWTWDTLLITLIGTPMSFLTFLFNFITLLSFLRHQELRGEPSNWYIIHLAFCDMFTGLHSMPSTMIADVFPCHPFPLWMCRIDRLLIWLVPQQSGTLVDLIAYDRMLMIIYGANYSRRETMRVVQWRIALSWLYNLVVFGLPNFLYLITGVSLSGPGVCIEEIFQIAWFGGFIGIVSAMVPTLICGVIYVASAYLLKKRTETLAKADAEHNNNTRALSSPSSPTTTADSGTATAAVALKNGGPSRQNAAARAREKREVAKRKRAFRFMAFMATAFLVCWFPSGIMIIIYTFSCSDQDVCKQNGMRSILQLTFYLFLSNSIIDPILYPFLMPKFRRLTIRMLTCGKRNYLFFKPKSQIEKPQQKQQPGGATHKKSAGGRKSGTGGGGEKISTHSARPRALPSTGARQRAVVAVAAARLASPERFISIDDSDKTKRLFIKHIDSDNEKNATVGQKPHNRRRQSDLLSSDDGVDYDDGDYDDEEEDSEDDVTPDISSPPDSSREIVWKKRRKSAEHTAGVHKQHLISPVAAAINNNNLRRKQSQSLSQERFLSCVGAGGQSTESSSTCNNNNNYANGASGSPMIVELHKMTN